MLFPLIFIGDDTKLVIVEIFRPKKCALVQKNFVREQTFCCAVFFR